MTAMVWQFDCQRRFGRLNDYIWSEKSSDQILFGRLVAEESYENQQTRQ
jgi:hypothetical protein